MYSYSKPKKRYRGQWKPPPPPPPQPGSSGHPRGGFRGNYKSPRKAKGAGHPTPVLKQNAFQEVEGFQDLLELSKTFYFGGGFKRTSSDYWTPIHKDGEPAEKKKRTTADNSEESGVEGEHMQSSSLEENEDWNIVSRNQFICFMCRFRTLYKEQMDSHLHSNFHKEHLYFVEQHLPKQQAAFLQELILYKSKKIQEQRGLIDDKAVRQLSQDHDCMQGLDMEHFVRKIETTNCTACNKIIPLGDLQQHLQSNSHKEKCRSMMKQSKGMALNTAKSILHHRWQRARLEKYMKGRNPFKDKDQESGQKPGSSLSDSEETAFEGKDSEKEMEVHKEEDADTEDDDEDYACEALNYSTVDRRQKVVK